MRLRSPEQTTDDYAQLIAETEKLAMSERYAEALAIIARESAIAPGNPELLCARAVALYNWGRYHEALPLYLQAEKGRTDKATLYLQLGWTFYQLGNLESAEAYLRRAVASNPHDPRAHFGLGIALDAIGRPADAAASHDRALELCPSEYDFLIGRGFARRQIGDAVSAEADFRAALNLRPDSARAWMSIGVALSSQGRDDEAINAFEHADKLEIERGEDVGNLPNLVISLRDAGRTIEAIEHSARRLSSQPSRDAYYALALSLLTAGKLPEGWEAHECRFWQEPTLSKRQRYNQPMWLGQDLRGRTILVCCEQGVGDTIQFARYLPMLKSLGATVLLVAYPRLQEFCRGFPGVDVVLGDGKLPEFDFYVYLMSLPRVFETTLSTIPSAIPYLHVNPDRVELWAMRIAARSRLKVGLAWAGNSDHQKDNERSLALSALLPLWEVEGVEFFAIQKGGAESELDSLPNSAAIDNLAPDLRDYCDTAAAINQLDLLITVDTSVAHLAGAMGKPVWTLLPKPSDWRWLEERADTPWYPTMRLFRQTSRRFWRDVVDQVHEALREQVANQLLADRATSSPAASSKGVLAYSPRDRAAAPWKPGLAAFIEMRHGMLQYFPDEGVEGESIGWYGEYLQPQLDVLGSLIKARAVVMEVGAGIGAHSLALARLIGSSGHLFLYEPRPIVQRVLRQNLSANQLTNVTVMRNSLGQTHPAEGRSPKTETIDELQLEQLHWLKINGNTCVWHVLEGAAETIWRLRPMLFVSVPDQRSLESARAHAEQLGYRCWRVDTPLFNPGNHNFRKVDIFDGRSVSALLAIPEEIEVDVTLDGCIPL